MNLFYQFLVNFADGINRPLATEHPTVAVCKDSSFLKFLLFFGK
jgi:hypothetical protein